MPSTPLCPFFTSRSSTKETGKDVHTPMLQSRHFPLCWAIHSKIRDDPLSMHQTQKTIHWACSECMQHVGLEKLIKLMLTNWNLSEVYFLKYSNQGRKAINWKDMPQVNELSKHEADIWICHKVKKKKKDSTYSSSLPAYSRIILHNSVFYHLGGNHFAFIPTFIFNNKLQLAKF